MQRRPRKPCSKVRRNPVPGRHRVRSRSRQLTRCYSLRALGRQAATTEEGGPAESDRGDEGARRPARPRQEFEQDDCDRRERREWAEATGLLLRRVSEDVQGQRAVFGPHQRQEPSVGFIFESACRGVPRALAISSFRSRLTVRANIFADLRRLGQTTKVKTSTLNDVRLKIAELREKSAAAADKKQYDFEQRIKEIKLAEAKEKEDQREAKRRKKEEERQKAEDELNKGADKDMMAMMGFGTFGGGAKR